MLWFPISLMIKGDINRFLKKKPFILKILYYVFLFIPLTLYLAFVDIVGLIINRSLYLLILRQPTNMWDDKIFPHMLEVRELLNTDIKNVKFLHRFKMRLSIDKIWRTLMFLNKKKDRKQTTTKLKKYLTDFPSRKEASIHIKEIFIVVYTKSI